MAVRILMKKAKKRAVGGVLVLDNDAINKASTEREVFVYLSAALRRQARVVTSAAVLAEIMRGGNRDTSLHRVVGQIVVEPVTAEIGLSAGRLIGEAGFDSTEVVDAIVAATAHDHAERAERASTVPDILVITADLSHLPTLVGKRQGVAVEHVEETVECPRPSRRCPCRRYGRSWRPDALCGVRRCIVGGRGSMCDQ